MSAPVIRVLLADDSAVIRRLITEALASDGEIDVVGAGRHGGEVLQLLPVQRPDVVLLDIEMPVMDGVETVVAIRKVNAQIPIVMFSSITTRGAEATFDAFSAGANDYVTKPSKLGHADEALNYIRAELVPKIKLWGRRQRLRNATQLKPVLAPSAIPARIPQPPPPVQNVPAPKMKDLAGPVEIVAIGASTGGPNALADILNRLPKDFPVPIVVTQHMPPVFTQLLAARLDTTCPLRVREGVDGAVLRPGEVWIAPGDFHMTVRANQTERVLSLDQNAQENSCRPAVDPMFRSVAAVYGSRCLGVVLTGMGRDGEVGSGIIRRAGGHVIAQDEASSVVWGMPRAVSQAGFASIVLPLPQIAFEIADIVRRSGNRSSVGRHATLGR